MCLRERESAFDWVNSGCLFDSAAFVSSFFSAFLIL